jgi:hypothetical protein
LSGQCRNQEFFVRLKSELLHLQGFESVGCFKRELLDSLDYYNNRCIKPKLGGLSLVHDRLRYEYKNQDSREADCLAQNKYYFCLAFLGIFKTGNCNCR